MNTEVGEFTVAGVTILISLFVWLGIDTYLYISKKPTISAKMYKWNKHISPIGHILMFLLGHWLW